MIVAVRVGSHTNPSAVGKSTILNQIFSNRSMFSSKCDPGSEHGKPLTLDGSVEMFALNQETASQSLWSSILQPHYSSGRNELILLANLHGDALQHPETLKHLRLMASTFVVFFMPMTAEEMKTKYKQLGAILELKECVFIQVDPTEECRRFLYEEQILDTSTLTADSTCEITRSAIRDALSMKTGVQSKFQAPYQSQVEQVSFVPNIWTTKSHELIEAVEKLGCRGVQSLLRLQKLCPKTSSYQTRLHDIWNTSPPLQEIISKFLSILRLPLKSRQVALSHLDRDLSLLSAKESAKTRRTIEDLKEQRRRIMTLEMSDMQINEKLKIEAKVSDLYVELNQIMLGPEHFYREIARLYQLESASSTQGTLSTIPNSCAEMLSYGHAIEVMDGDILDMYGPWFNAVCHSICKTMPDPDMKVFVISIIGLQSSGKSTLLNALFGCKFAVSVGRCTRGLFMRILYLEESLVQKIGVQAIVVLDTEGLGAGETNNDPNAEQKDRFLATFAMSASNLTLVNIQGESFRELTDILQIVVITMARLEKANISPDILMVQHLSEKDSSKTMQATDEFCNALNEAVTSTVGINDMEIGVHNLKSLARLQRRVSTGEILHQFPSFKNGATINAPPSQQYHENILKLYNKILESCKDTASPQSFHQWHEVMKEYLDAVSSQDFSLRFRNIKDVQEFIEMGRQIARLKEAITGAFCDHRDTFKVEITRAFNDAKSSGTLSRWESSTKTELILKITAMLQKVPHQCFCQKCRCVTTLQAKLFSDVKEKPSEMETQNTILKFFKQTRTSSIAHLQQMADALLVRQGLSLEHHKIIDEIIKEKLMLKSHYNDHEILRIVDEIWNRVFNEVSLSLTVSSAKTRILKDISQEYKNISPATSANVSKQTPHDLIDIKALKNGTWYGWASSCLNSQQETFLQILVEEVSITFFRNRGSDHYENGMIGPLRKKIDEALGKYEKDRIPKGRLCPKFKWLVHDNILMNFMKAMVAKQSEWDKNNNPLTILKGCEEQYRNEIGIRLKYGFSFEAEGRLVSDLLVRAIRQKAQKVGDNEQVMKVRGLPWLTGSENVRLKYFSELSDEVERGYVERAYTHFRKPSNIKTWFSEKVDSITKHAAETKFNRTTDAEYDYVYQSVFNSSICEDVLSFVDEYLSVAGIIEYERKITFDNASESDVNIFKTTILRHLESGKPSLKQNVEILNPSNCPEVLQILGCTQSCFWCKALCWGENGHETNSGVTQKHHSCHQPQGLARTINKHTKCLKSIACHDLDSSNYMMYWGPHQEDGLSWEKTKVHPDFSGWLFNKHNRSEFDDLMKWFFVKLQSDIASRNGLKEADFSEFVRERLHLLPDRTHIIATIKTKLGL